MKVQLESGLWIPDSKGEAETTIEENAKNFDDIHEAAKALQNARKHKAFPNALIQQDDFI